MNQTTFAPSADPAVGTQTTPTTDTADGADYSISQRIDVFIKKYSGVAVSDAFSGARDSAEAATRYGFRNSANSRYAEFLAGFRDSPELAAHYQDLWPACSFLPWRAFHGIRKSLSLWCDLPEHYTGAIPDKQLKRLDAFMACPAEDIDNNHVDARDLESLFNDSRLEALILSQFEFSLSPDGKYHDHIRRRFGNWHNTVGPAFRHHRRSLSSDMQHQLAHGVFWPMMHSLFVMAPKEAFNTEKDWFARAEDLSKAAMASEPRITPDDPLVVCFVHGGALVVAAWGEEAAELNQIVRDLKL